jgi:hypothetical protein
LKQVVAICCLCEGHIPLGPEDRDAGQDQAKVFEHLSQHTLNDWIEGVQALRARVEQLDQLRAMPRCAMPRA